MIDELFVSTEKEHQKQLERERKEQRKAERGELRIEQQQHEEGNPVVEKKDVPQQVEESAAGAAMHNEGIVKVAHSMTHDNSHPEVVRSNIHRSRNPQLSVFNYLFLSRRDTL